MNQSRRGEARSEEAREVLTAPEGEHHSALRWQTLPALLAVTSQAPRHPRRLHGVRWWNMALARSRGKRASCWDTGKIPAAAKWSSSGDTSRCSEVSPRSPMLHLLTCISDAVGAFSLWRSGQMNSCQEKKALKPSRHRCTLWKPLHPTPILPAWKQAPSFWGAQGVPSAAGTVCGVTALQVPLNGSRRLHPGCELMHVNNRFKCGGWMSHCIPAFELCNRIQMQKEDQLT